MDKNTYKLLTPGPLTTTETVKEAMQIDRCTWDEDYKNMTQEIRTGLLKLAHADNGDYTTVLMQGSGTFGVESVLSGVISSTDKVLVLQNGAYARPGHCRGRFKIRWEYYPYFHGAQRNHQRPFK